MGRDGIMLRGEWNVNLIFSSLWSGFPLVIDCDGIIRGYKQAVLPRHRTRPYTRLVVCLYTVIRTHCTLVLYKHKRGSLTYISEDAQSLIQSSQCQLLSWKPALGYYHNESQS
jgi:hypothetical protein